MFLGEALSIWALSFFSIDSRASILYGRGVATDVANGLLSQCVFDHARMHTLHQFAAGELFKGTTEGGLAGQCKTQIKAAQSKQFAVSLQMIYQRAAIHLRLAYPTALCVAPITVDRQLYLRELEDANDLFELCTESRLVLLHQPYEFALQGRKSLDGDGTQGSRHGRTSS